MVTNTILARAKRLKSRVSANQNAHSPAPKTGAQKCTLATRPPTLLSPSATVTVSPSVAPVTSRQQQSRPVSLSSQTPSQPQRTNLQTQSSASASISAPATASTASPQTRAQSCQSTSTTTPLQILPPIASTAIPQTQSSSSISASTPPQPPNASTPSLQTQSSWSTLASIPPRPPDPSTSGPQTQSHASNPGAGTPQLSTPPSLQAQPCPLTPASTQGLAPAAGTASLQKKSLSSALLSASRGVARRNWKIFSGGCITVALAFAGVYLTGLYGKVTLKYTRWTLNNDFRDGCINDLDHNLTLAEECFAELAHPRVSAVNMKRQLGAVQDAFADNALYWTVAVCMLVSTCVFYLVWMRRFTRDGPRPVVSPVKMDFSNFGQGQHGNGNAMMTQIDETLSDLSHIWDHKVYDHLQPAEMGATILAPGPDEDYFQAWRDKMKSPQEDIQAGNSDTESTRSDPRRYPLPLSPRRTSSVEALFERDSRQGSVSSKDSTWGPEEVFEVEFKPSGNRAKCQLIALDGPISEFQPTDGVQFDLYRRTKHSGVSVLKVPLERGATAVSLVSQPLNRRAYRKTTLSFSKRIMWARRVGLPTHRFVYLVVRDELQGMFLPNLRVKDADVIEEKGVYGTSYRVNIANN